MSDLVGMRYNSLNIAFTTLCQHFPDYDGVVGFEIRSIPNPNPYQYILIGQQFVKRLNRDSLYCPEYFSYYAETELARYIDKTCPDKFIIAKGAKIDVYDPEVHLALQDKEYDRIKVYRKKDEEFAEYRKMMDLTWGID